MEQNFVKIILTTVPSRDSASHIAKALVEKKIAACVSIIPQIKSVFRWDGKVQEEEELLLLIKTTEERYQQLEEEIRSLHPYTCPEILALATTAGFADYCAWVRAETSEENSQ